MGDDESPGHRARGRGARVVEQREDRGGQARSGGRSSYRDGGAEVAARRPVADAHPPGGVDGDDPVPGPAEHGRLLAQQVGHLLGLQTVGRAAQPPPERREPEQAARERGRADARHDDRPAALQGVDLAHRHADRDEPDDRAGGRAQRHLAARRPAQAALLDRDLLLAAQRPPRIGRHDETDLVGLGMAVADAARIGHDDVESLRALDDLLRRPLRRTVRHRGTTRDPHGVAGVGGDRARDGQGLALGLLGDARAHDVEGSADRDAQRGDEHDDEQRQHLRAPRPAASVRRRPDRVVGGCRGRHRCPSSRREPPWSRA